MGTLIFEYPTLGKNVGTSLLFNYEEIRKDRLFALGDPWQDGGGGEEGIF